MRQQPAQLRRHPAHARAQPRFGLRQRRLSAPVRDRRAEPTAAPAPPPRTLVYGPSPPSPPPPPRSPPPYYADAEACIPLPTLAYFGLDATAEAVADAPTEERASCLFVRRIADTRRRASSCFAKIAHPHPPPPPDRASASQTAANSERLQRWRLDDLEQYDAPRKTDRAQWDADTSGALAGTEALIASLGETSPVLKALLDNALNEIRGAGGAGRANAAITTTFSASASAASASASAAAPAASATTSTAASSSYGRRLLERNDYEILMTDALVDNDVMNFYGKDGIPGVTVGSCEALCEATKKDANRTDASQCYLYGFKRQAPFSYVDLTGRCWLLRAAGACKPEDFGIELYTRNIESERQCTALAPGLWSAQRPHRPPRRKQDLTACVRARFRSGLPRHAPDRRRLARAQPRRRRGLGRGGALSRLPGAGGGRTSSPSNNLGGYEHGRFCTSKRGLGLLGPLPQHRARRRDFTLDLRGR